MPALIVADAVARLIPGVLGDSQSALEDSFQDGLLGAPTYTRPAHSVDLRFQRFFAAGITVELLSGVRRSDNSVPGSGARISGSNTSREKKRKSYTLRTMAKNLLKIVEATQLRETPLPDIEPGDTIAVHLRVIEGEKERIQIFQGTVISIRGGGANRTFTVRKISGGVGVERIFPFHSPRIARVEVKRRGKVRRAKLFYLRTLRGKAARIKERMRDS